MLRINLYAMIDTPGLLSQWQKAEAHYMVFSENLPRWLFHHCNSLNRSWSCGISFSSVDFGLRMTMAPT